MSLEGQSATTSPIAAGNDQMRPPRWPAASRWSSRPTDQRRRRSRSSKAGLGMRRLEDARIVVGWGAMG